MGHRAVLAWARPLVLPVRVDDSSALHHLSLSLSLSLCVSLSVQGRVHLMLAEHTHTHGTLVANS